MKVLLLAMFALASWNTVIFAEDGSEVCSIVSEDMIESGVVLEDYNFGVRPVVKADQITLDPVQKLDLSIYEGKVILFTIFSSQCGWCLKDLEYFNEYEKQWPKDSVVMVNVAFGKEGDTSKSLYTGPQELLDFVIEDYKQREFDLKNMEFYYFSHTTHAEEQGEKSSFKLLQELMTSNGESLLFPDLRGTPYSIIVDQKGRIRFRGHFTSGDESPQAKFEKHYNYIDSLIKDNCQTHPL